MDDCPSSNIQPIGLVKAIAGLVYGILFAMFGYRSMRAVGFILGGFTGYLLLNLLKPLDFNEILDLILVIIVAFACATIGSKPHFALGIINAYGGALIFFLLVTGIIATVNFEFTPTHVYLAIAFGAVLFLLFTFRCGKCVTIISTSFLGVAMYLCALDYFLHDMTTFQWIENLKLNPDLPPCWGHILLILFPILVFISCFIQKCITAKNFVHPKSPPKPTATRTQYFVRPCTDHYVHGKLGSVRYKENKANKKYRKCRYLYQVRKPKVCSPMYFKDLQRRIISRCFPKKKYPPEEDKCTRSFIEVGTNKKYDCTESTEVIHDTTTKKNKPAKKKNKPKKVNQCPPDDNEDCQNVGVIKLCKKK